MIVVESTAAPRQPDDNYKRNTNYFLVLIVFIISLIIATLASTVINLGSTASNISFAVALLVIALITILITGAILINAIISICKPATHNSSTNQSMEEQL